MRITTYWPRSPEIGRRVLGVLVEAAIKAYGAAGAVSVALSDAETPAGKADDAIRAIPNLMDRYRDATYVVEHKQEIQSALDYVDQHAPDLDALEAGAQRSTETLEEIQTTYDEVVAAREALGFSPGALREVADHLGNAWDARPDLDSIGRLADLAESAVPFVEQVEVLVPAFYGGLLTLADNFASDEIGSTLAVMGLALAAAFVLSRTVGFWARRGMPGLLSRALQSGGARLFPGWYARNLEYALGPPLYAVARRRTRDDIVADPQRALDAEAFRALEEYFAHRQRRDPSGAIRPPDEPRG